MARGDPLRLQVTLRGASTVLADRVVLSVAEGRVHLARTVDRFGVDAVVRILLAEGGSVEPIPEVPPTVLADAPTFESMFAQAERQARQVLDPVEPLGGLGTVLKADLDNLVAMLRQIPDAANRIMRLADGRRNVAQLLVASPYDEGLTARIVGKLHRMGILLPTTPTGPASGSRDIPVRAETGAAVGATEWLMPNRGWGETSNDRRCVGRAIGFIDADQSTGPYHANA